MNLALFLLVFILVFLVFLAYRVGLAVGKKREAEKFEQEVPLIRKDAISRSRAVLSGNFAEQLSPFFPNFPYLPTECKFLGSPVDFIVFKGSDKKEIEEIVFVEVKSGKSRLNSQEKSLKEAVENKNVKWFEYRIPDEFLGGEDS